MWKLYHHQIQQIANLQKLLVESLAAYHGKDYHYQNKFNDFIDQIVSWAQQSHQDEILGQILIIASEYQHAVRGLDPLNYVKVVTGRNDFKRMYFLKSISRLEEILAREKHKLQLKIDEASTDISTLILSAIQSGNLDVTDLGDMKQDDILLFWKSLNGNGDVIAIKSRIATKVGYPDIQLIILDLFAKISNGLAV